MSILDFKELSGKAEPGENLEGLVRELGSRLDLRPDWSGRGTDQGRDLYFTERRKGTIGSYELKWIVSCKDYANSGRSVTEKDLGSVLDKVRQHKAQGFLLVTTTTASTGAKAVLDGLHSPGSIETKVWDRHELERLLIQDAHTDLLKRFLPASYARIRQYSSLPMAMQALEVLLPGPINQKIRDVIATYQIEDSWITGEHIWRHDRKSAATIDLALTALLEQDDAEAAARILGENFIEFEAFNALFETLSRIKPGEAADLCRAVVRVQVFDGQPLFAFQFYVDHFEPSNYDQIELAAQLSSDDLYELYAEEVTVFVDDHLMDNPTGYQAWGDLDALSSRTRLEEANSFDVSFTANAAQIRIDFTASVSVAAVLSHDGGDVESSMNFLGKVEGYINAHGMFIENFTVDTDGFYH